MIDVETRTKAVLVASATVTALVPAARVQTSELPLDVVFPAISILEISSVGDYTQDGPGLIKSRVQVDAWAKSKASARAIAIAVRDAIQAFAGEPDGIQDFADAGRRVLYEDDTKLHRISSDFFAWSRDAAA